MAFGILGGIVKNIFPKHTILGGILGSTRTAGQGAIGNIFEKKAKAQAAAVQAYTPPFQTPQALLVDSSAGGFKWWFVAAPVAFLIGLYLIIKK